VALGAIFHFEPILTPAFGESHVGAHNRFPTSIIRDAAHDIIQFGPDRHGALAARVGQQPAFMFIPGETEDNSANPADWHSESESAEKPNKAHGLCLLFSRLPKDYAIASRPRSKIIWGALSLKAEIRLVDKGSKSSQKFLLI
jgi:hypothetical protein